MKRKDFLRKMRNRRRGGSIEQRQPERRRAVDWRTLRVELPAVDDPVPEPEQIPVGRLARLPTGIRLEASGPCWVRGYRLWEEEGVIRAELQYRPVEPESRPPPGATGLDAGDVWEPEG